MRKVLKKALNANADKVKLAEEVRKGEMQVLNMLLNVT